ncbi:DMT family transporter [Novosphingobium mangrovi (ex Huang et al. 2023)]|uniref:DMT family transporter n=1 Tax=Novosphingobium mangrovi (ex Huang et al. 2023) TaxID=2976432 RepID=A0ABT2HZG3_9SPHN|nr:DMT family transporter [Novosphingobium mangrovi (ex Huang et al. 2023)]MCT2397945.1 DMT family transporter [Novosphingobium mangrovi (ex Huang et al. 2023)]
MAHAPAAPHSPGHEWTARHLAALLMANFALALGPWLVRLADTGPVAAGFWRLGLALPVLLLLSSREPIEQRSVRGAALALVLGGGVFFALDLASWHVGIETTKLGNASLFGNGGSVILMAWGLIAARRSPRMLELTAIASALGGAALLMGGSLEISRANLIGDLFCALAGFFYAFYILMLNSARAKLGQFSVLAVSVCASAPVMLGIAALRGETIMPQDWTPLIALAFSSQLVGQGLLIYSLRHFPPLMIGLALLTQPAVSSTMGWLAFGETLTPLDVLGMVLLAAALVMARLGDRG